MAIGLPTTVLAFCYGLLYSESFVKTGLLPRINAASGLNISANQISISPLSEISLKEAQLSYQLSYTISGLNPR